MPPGTSGQDGDPFDTSKAEVESLLGSSRVALNRLRSYERQLLQQKQQQHARTGSSVGATVEDSESPTSASSPNSSLVQRAERAVVEATQFLDNASDEVGLLRSVVEALKSGRVRKASVPHHVLSSREDFVEESEQAIEGVRRELADITRAGGPIAIARAEHAKVVELQRASAAARLRSRAAERGTRAVDDVDGRGANDDDDFDNEPLDFEEHKAKQARIREEQDATLDRLHAGLTTAGQRASLIGLAVDEDARELEQVGHEIEAVDAKLATQMRRVNKLLDEMSTKRKCGLIMCLMFTALILFLLMATL